MSSPEEECAEGSIGGWVGVRKGIEGMSSDFGHRLEGKTSNTGRTDTRRDREVPWGGDSPVVETRGANPVCGSREGPTGRDYFLCGGIPILCGGITASFLKS